MWGFWAQLELGLSLTLIAEVVQPSTLDVPELTRFLPDLTSCPNFFCGLFKYTIFSRGYQTLGKYLSLWGWKYNWMSRSATFIFRSQRWWCQWECWKLISAPDLTLILVFSAFYSEKLGWSDKIERAADKFVIINWLDQEDTARAVRFAWYGIYPAAWSCPEKNNV